jgi:hypothetical protein
MGMDFSMILTAQKHGFGGNGVMEKKKPAA